MSSILAHAQGLVYTLLSMMPSHYQRDSLQAILGLFLQVQGHPLPQQCQAKSARRESISQRVFLVTNEQEK